MICTKKLKVPIYNRTLNLLIYDEVVEALAWAKLQCDNKELDFRGEFDSFDGGFFNYDDTQFIMIEMNDDISPGVIAHECKHAVNDTFVQVGVELDKFNDEAECYLLTWYVNQVHTFISETKEKF